jgi:hypothetical protein
VYSKSRKTLEGGAWSRPAGLVPDIGAWYVAIAAMYTLSMDRRPTAPKEKREWKRPLGDA